MTDDENLLDRFDDSRRSFMKKGAVASGVAALGIGSTETAGAQDDGILQEGQKGLIFPDNFHPRARFAFVSPVLQWVPNYAQIRDDIWSEYVMRQIRWQGTGNVVPFWPVQGATVGEFDEDLGFVTDANDDANQPQLFEMNQEWTPFADNPRFITVNFSPVDEQQEDNILQDDNWWQEGGGGGDGGGGDGGGGG